MKHNVNFIVNDQSYSLEVESQDSLLDVLRNKINLIGTKKGCDSGQCGACTVIMDDLPVNACLVLAVECEGKKILTIEGLAKGLELDPLQQSFIDYHAVQCGYCTPGMIMSAKALLDENPFPTEEEIKRALVGNLCRCTGYIKIINAIHGIGNR